MPYTTRRFKDGTFAVYKKGADGRPEGRAFGRHASQKQAQAQIAALEAREQGEQKKADKYAGIDTRPTDAMADAVTKALSGDPVDANPEHVALAQKIKNRQPLSPREVRYIARATNANGLPLRGGDTGQTWARGVVARFTQRDEEYKAARVKSVQLSQAEVEYQPQSPVADTCASCRWFQAEGGCYIVAPDPDPITAAGYCFRHEPRSDGQKLLTTSNAGSVGFGVPDDQKAVAQRGDTAVFKKAQVVRVKTFNTVGKIADVTPLKSGEVIYGVKLKDGGFASVTAKELEVVGTDAAKRLVLRAAREERKKRSER